MKRIIYVLALLAGIGDPGPALAKDKPTLPPIAVRVSPKVVVSAPLQSLRVEIIIPRNKENRGYCVIIDGPSLYSSSCATLAGDNAPAFFEASAGGFTENGEYVVVAQLFTTKFGLSKPAAAASDKVLIGAQRASITDN